MISLLSFSIIKIAVITGMSFLIGFLATPALLRVMHKYKLWRKTVRQTALGGGALPVFQKFHTEGEVKTPRFGGILVWLIPPFVAMVLWLLSKTGNPWLESMNFL